MRYPSENDSELELIFVIMNSYTGGKVAIEGDHGMVVFGENVRDLKDNIVVKVQDVFNGRFAGTVRLRKFSDILIHM